MSITSNLKVILPLLKNKTELITILSSDLSFIKSIKIGTSYLAISRTFNNEVFVITNGDSRVNKTINFFSL